MINDFPVLGHCFVGQVRGTGHPSFFAASSSGRFSVVPMLIAAANAGKVTGEIYADNWHDIGTKERLATLRSL